MIDSNEGLSGDGFAVMKTAGAAAILPTTPRATDYGVHPAAHRFGHDLPHCAVRPAPHNHPPLLWISLCTSPCQTPEIDGFPGAALDCPFFEQSFSQLDQALAPIRLHHGGHVPWLSRKPDACGFPFPEIVNACLTGGA